MFLLNPKFVIIILKNSELQRLCPAFKRSNTQSDVVSSVVQPFFFWPMLFLRVVSLLGL